MHPHVHASVHMSQLCAPLGPLESAGLCDGGRRTDLGKRPLILEEGSRPIRQEIWELLIPGALSWRQVGINSRRSHRPHAKRMWIRDSERGLWKLRAQDKETPTSQVCVLLVTSIFPVCTQGKVSYLAHRLHISIMWRYLYICLCLLYLYIFTSSISILPTHLPLHIYVYIIYMYVSISKYMYLSISLSVLLSIYICYSIEIGMPNTVGWKASAL